MPVFITKEEPSATLQTFVNFSNFAKTRTSGTLLQIFHRLTQVLNPQENIMIASSIKAAVVLDNARHAGDTGSPEV